MAEKKRILVAPLDWGLGHATRCVPVIQELLTLGAEVLIGSSGKALALLRQAFPELPYMEMPSYRVSYPRDGNMSLHMLKLAPRVGKAIQKENRLLDRYIREHGIDGVISDNRLGLYNKRVPTVLITHQLFIRTPRFRWAVDRLNRHYLSRFDRCWVPDVADLHENLSGALSHGKELPKGISYIGPLSRFDGKGSTEEEREGGATKPRVLGLISGPEPQRGMLVDGLNEEIKDLGLDATLVTGAPDQGERKKESPKIRAYPHLKTDALAKEIEAADLIISRSGYSTIMDLAALGRKAVLIPTPGQSEQEYLGLYHHKKGHFLSMQQDEFDLESAIEKVKAFQGIHLAPNREGLREKLRELL